MSEIVQPDDHSVRLELPSEEALALLPERYRTGQAAPAGGTVKTTLVIENLFAQLAQGRVAVPTAQLALGMPPSLVAATAFLDQQPITLPLALVVTALDPAVMRSKVAGMPRVYDIGRLPDFFHLDPVLPPASPAACERPVATPAPPAAEAPLTEDLDPAERLAGVNLNAATLEQLTALDGVAAAVAQRIVDYRTRHGPFRDVFDLAEVPRIGRKTFRAITGMPYSVKRRHRREKLASLLGIPPARAAHLPTIARALAAQPGFSACVISDQQGFLLAANGADGSAEAFSAVLPTLTREIRNRMRECTPEIVDSISLRVGGHLFTIVPSGDVYLTAMHRASRLTMSQFRLVTRVAAELAWLAGRRGYVATSPVGSPAVGGPGQEGSPPA